MMSSEPGDQVIDTSYRCSCSSWKIPDREVGSVREEGVRVGDARGVVPGKDHSPDL